jgi:hypothetical protein
MKHKIKTPIKKGDFVRIASFPTVWLYIEEEFIDPDTGTMYWTSTEDGGEYEISRDEIEQVIDSDDIAVAL